MKNVSIIGSGFSGLSAACFLAQQGHRVAVFEKNSTLGGRARSFEEQGFKFDMGPSWYWMPDVFDRFFESFGKKTSDYYQLQQLDPGFQMIFSKTDVLQVPASMEGITQMFESIEPGSTTKLKQFLADGAYKYQAGMTKLVFNPCFSWMEFARRDVIAGAAHLHLFRSVRSHVKGYFKDPRLVALMEFPVLFLGAMAHQIPALYTLMNYAALSMGTWYPDGGMIRIVDAMADLAKSMGVTFHTNTEVSSIQTTGNRATGIITPGRTIATDGVVATGDYHHMEQALLPPALRNYPAEYWDKKTFAPSSLIFYLGVNKKIKKLIHHNLFFDESLDQHSREIYDTPQWPSKPLFYACCPSKTDDSVAPAGHENLFLLIPVAPGLQDTPAIREQYFQTIMKRMEDWCGEPIIPHIVYNKSYCITDFENDYHAYKGNAYGLANTLMQTAVLKPSMRNKKLKNLFYAGQLTVPGPGVPPALISGQIAAGQMNNLLKSKQHEATV